jgi:hypothetical protein
MKKISLILTGLLLTFFAYGAEPEEILSPKDLDQGGAMAATQTAETEEAEREGMIIPAIAFTESGYVVKRWWEGGQAKMSAMGNMVFAVPDKTSIIDLYSFGYTSAILKRQKMNMIDLSAGYRAGRENAALDLFGAYSDDASVVYWITDNDVLCLKPVFVKEEGYTEFYDIKFEYAKDLGNGFGTGGSIKKSSLIKRDLDEGTAHDSTTDTNYDYTIITKLRGEKTEWRLNLDYTGRVDEANMFFNQGFAYTFALGAGNESEAPLLNLLKSIAWNETGRLSYLYGYDGTVSISDLADFENTSISDSAEILVETGHKGTAIDLAMFIALDGKNRAELLIKTRGVFGSEYSNKYESAYSIFSSDNEVAERLYRGYILGVDFIERLYVGDYRDLILSARYSLTGYNYTAEKTPDGEEKGFFDRKSVLSIGVTYDPGTWLLALEGDVYDYVQGIKAGFEAAVSPSVVIRGGGRVDFDFRYEYLYALASYGMNLGTGIKWGSGVETDITAGYFSDNRYVDSVKAASYGDIATVSGPEARVETKYRF